MDFGNKPWRMVLISALLCVATWAVYWPVRQHDFVLYDDQDYVFKNPQVLQGLTWANVRWALATGAASNWHPLTWVSHMLDVQLFGLDPGWHHLTNVFWHSANAVLLFLLLQRITKATWRSAFVAALFALHPLHVESVAWVAERKDVLSTCFFLLTIWAYANSVDRRAGSGSSGSAAGARISYFTSIVLFALGLMCKPMLVTLPFVLLLLDVWPLRRFDAAVDADGSGKFESGLSCLIGLAGQSSRWKQLLWEKMPYFALAAASCVATYLAQSHGHAVKPLPLLLRLANASASYLKYLGKIFWPANLCVAYPYPRFPHLSPPQDDRVLTAAQWPEWALLATVVALGALSLLALAHIGQRPYLAVGWFWYLVTLTPVIGLVQVGSQARADRYTYISSIGIFICLSWGGAWLLGPESQGGLAGAETAGHLGPGARLRQGGAGLGVVILLLGCMAASRQQVGYWRNTTTLFEHALVATADNTEAHCGLAAQLMSERQYERALEQLQAALAIEPSNFEVHLNMAMIFEHWGQTNAAITNFQAVLRFRPAHEIANIHLAMLLESAGRRDEALAVYAATARRTPESAAANYGLGVGLAAQGLYAEATPYLEQAVKLRPSNLQALTELGRVLAGQNRFADAEAAFRNAAQLSPTNLNLLINLGNAQALGGRSNAAAATFAQAVRLDPDLARKYVEDARAMAEKRDMPSAVARLRTALWLEPNQAQALQDLAWLLATAPQAKLRNGAEAVRLAQHALELRGEDSRSWAALDAAYAEAGQFADAIAAAQRTRNLALATGQRTAAEEAENRLARYQQQQAFHQ